MRDPRYRPRLLALTVAGLAAGCGPAEEPQDSDLVLGEYTEERAEGHAEHPGEHPAPPAESIQQVEAIIGADSLALSTDTVPAGPTNLMVMNTTRAATGCVVQGEGGSWEVRNLIPAAAASVVMELKPGSYRIRCPVTRGEATEEGGTEVQATLVAR